MTWPPALARWIELPIRFSVIWRNARASATTGGSVCASEVRMMMRSRLACGCITATQLSTRSLRFWLAKARSSLPVSIRRQIEEVVDDGDHAFAGGANVLHVFDVALVAERAEALADHHFGKADDGVERRADLMADPRQQVGLGVGRAIGQPPRLAQFAFALLGLRQIAEHGEEIRTVGPGPSHGHRQRDQAAAARRGRARRGRDRAGWRRRRP